MWLMDGKGRKSVVEPCLRTRPSQLDYNDATQVYVFFGFFSFFSVLFQCTCVLCNSVVKLLVRFSFCGIIFKESIALDLVFLL